jgi:hypothetical protein
MEFKSHEFKAQLKCLTLPHYVFKAEDFRKCFLQMLDLIWPVEPSRMVRLSLINMKRRSKNEEIGTSKLDSFLGKAIVNLMTDKNMIVSKETNEEDVLNETNETETSDLP